MHDETKAVLLATLAVVTFSTAAWCISGQRGYERGQRHEFTSCTVSFSRERLISENNCDFTSSSTADSKWMLKMLTRNSDF